MLLVAGAALDFKACTSSRAEVLVGRAFPPRLWQLLPKVAGGSEPHKMFIQFGNFLPSWMGCWGGKSPKLSFVMGTVPHPQFCFHLLSNFDSMQRMNA